MKTAVILAAGAGTRIWPYAEIRPKVMIPVANKPLVEHNVELLQKLGYGNIIIAAGPFCEQIRNYYRNRKNIKVVNVGKSGGTAFSLSALKDYLNEDFLVLYGDTLVEEQDLQSLIEAFEAERTPCALISPLGDEASNDWICCAVMNGCIYNITGHPRYRCDHRFCGFALTVEMLPYMESNSGIFTNVNVGMAAPMEGYLEMSLSDCIKDGNSIKAVIARGTFIDIDKPWHILSANAYIVNELCGQLEGNVLAEGASIDSSAEVGGYVKLGKGSRIGRNVIIKGSLIAGENTVIDNSAVINGNLVVGDNCRIVDYCQVGGGSAVGNDCIIAHCAEFAGLLMDRVYLYHYMEFWGVIGTCTDLGAATVCGTLRFDDSLSTHMVKGRREKPRSNANASYLGDFSRTGVNAIIMPGCKTGVYSVVGPGVVLTEDVPNNTLVMVEQQLVKKQWGPERYGW